MNDSLIKQLELAIQVEKGEVPWGEIQYRPLSEPPEFGWICVAPCGKPSWNFTNAEYRRKPKPLECWVAEYGLGHHKLLWNKDSEPIARPPDCSAPTRMIKMREVTNE